MPQVPAPRDGAPVLIKKAQVPFSFWPMRRTIRRYGLHGTVYATNPLAVVRDSINRYCQAPARAEALAYVSQCEYFLRAASSNDEWAAKPLLLYYAFMNLAKSYVLTQGVRPTLNQARHGLSERLGTGGKELVDAYLEAYPAAPTGSPNVFADLVQALTSNSLGTQLRLDVTALLPQVVAGHRLWSNAALQNERFINVSDILFMSDAPRRELWATVQLRRSNLTRYDIDHADLLAGAGLDTHFREVRPPVSDTTGEFLYFEQIAVTPYTHRPSDEIPAVASSLRGHLWATVTTVPPHRQYYFYMAPAAERGAVLPQLASIYVIAYYLGSITRYRPQHFGAILNSVYGGFVQEFLTSQPSQFIYLLASDFARRDVTKAAIA